MSYLFSAEQEIKNDSGNPVPISIKDAVGNNNSSEHPVYVNAAISNAQLTVGYGESNVDAFGNLRVSTPTTLGDYNHVSGENPEMITVLTGAGTGTADVNTSSYVLQVGSGATDSVIHQSRMYHHYLPGKSQLVKFSFALGPARANTIKRTGYFDDRNGIFLQQAGDGTLSIVERTNSNSTGTITENVYPQSSWNVDTCSKTIAGTGLMPDGSQAVNYGKTGSWTLDQTKTQLMMVDFQWLGVGRIRIGFVHDGRFILAHEIMHSNYLSIPYWRQPSLPVRCEIRNTAAAVGTASLRQVCSTVISEGGYTETGLVKTAHSSLLGRILVNGGDTMPVIAIRLKNSINGDPNRSTVRIRDMHMMVTDAPIYYELRKFDSHTAITGGTWTAADSESAVEINTTATAWTGGFPLAGDFLAAAASKNTISSSGVVGLDPNKRGFIAQNYDSSDSQCYALIATTIGSTNNVNAAVYGSLQWNETR